MIQRTWFLGCFAVAAGVGAVACANGDAAMDGTDAPTHLDGGTDVRADRAAPETGAGEDRDATAGDAANNPVDATGPDDANQVVDAEVPIAVDASDAEAPRDASASDALAPHDAAPDVEIPDASVVPDVAVPPIDSGTCPTPVALLINEVQSDGATAADEFVEIFNPNDCAVALAGWSLRYSSAGASTPATKWTGGASDSVAGHGYAVIRGGGFTGATNQVIGAFVGSTGVLAKAAGAIGLHDAAGNLVDGIAYGSAPNNPEGKGSPAPELSSGHSDARSSTSADTGNNATDFSLTSTPTPGTRN